MKRTKYVALLLSIFFVFSLISPAIANEEPPMNVVYVDDTLGSLTYQDSTQKVYSLTDKQSLEELIKRDNIEVPEGYELASVETIILYTEPYITNNLTEHEILLEEEITPFTTYWVKWISNVRRVSDAYYANRPLYSDWLDGPAPNGITYNLKDVVNASFSSKFGFKAAEITAEVGFNVTEGHEITREFTTQAIPSNRQLNVQIFTNYAVTNFDENRYLQSGGIRLPTETEVGSAWKPVGYVIQQQLYVKN